MIFTLTHLKWISYYISSYAKNTYIYRTQENYAVILGLVFGVWDEKRTISCICVEFHPNSEFKFQWMMQFIVGHRCNIMNYWTHEIKPTYMIYCCRFVGLYKQNMKEKRTWYDEGKWNQQTWMQMIILFEWYIRQV